jgi:alcohol dehydrogenase class IV
MKDFIFKTPTKIIFGTDAALRLGEVISKYNAKKVFIISDQFLASMDWFTKIVDSLKALNYEYEVYLDTVPEPPIEIIDKTVEILKKSGSDILVAIGGGSIIDTSKAAAMLMRNEGSIKDYLFGGSKEVVNKPMTLICIPTTAGSGSEVTGASVISDIENDIKLSVSNELLIPEISIIDPVVQKGMPPALTASTGMDALTHAIEAYTSINANQLSDTYAKEAIKLIGENIYKATFNPNDLLARGNMALGSVMAATAFANAGLGVVHGISQAMGGVAHVPHGVANSMLLPYCMEINMIGNLEKFKNIASLLGKNVSGLSLREGALKGVNAVKEMSEDLPIANTLSEVGVTKEMYESIVKGTMEYRLLALNPVKITDKDVYKILNKAY